MIYDCFMFFNELELLEIRLNELYDTVDKFVLVEASTSHQGRSKPLYFNDNKHLFKPFLDKIDHIIVKDLPTKIHRTDTAEAFHRDCIMRGLTKCGDNDIIIVSDADEIGRATSIQSYDPSMGMHWLRVNLYNCYLNCAAGNWQRSYIAPYSFVKQHSPNGIRVQKKITFARLNNAGWHWSYMGGVDKIITKLESFLHSEFNTPHNKDKKKLQEYMDNNLDILGRVKGNILSVVSIDDSYPKYILDNIDKYEAMGWIKK
jgi:beta-1,4-mannosyl-glycoprotein beta-1,4-N-acetylglucosaminyltransferase